MSSFTVSLEPPPLYVNQPDDESPVSLFDKPLRLLDINPTEIYTRGDPGKSVGERLNRIFVERGDFSKLTSESIINKVPDVEVKDISNDGDEGKVSPEVMRELQTKLMEQLNLARGELTTALDLLSVLAPVTIPPSVDPESLPLPSETLTIIPTQPPPKASPNPIINNLASLPIATSLATIKSSALSFFTAFEQLMIPPSSSNPSSSSPPRNGSPSPRSKSVTPDLWTSLLDLRSKSSYSLVPLGAVRGATLTGAGESRVARSVGVFYGCEEAKEPFRRAAVARVSELIESIGEEGTKTTTAGRKFGVTLRMEGKEEEIAVWNDEKEEGTDDSVIERVLRRRGRCAFSEELFSILSNEVRADATLQARIKLGKRSVGDSIFLEGHGWSITFTMITNPPLESQSNRKAQVVLALLRLLLIEQYSQRRSCLIRSPTNTRVILPNISVLLIHTRRLGEIEMMLNKTVQRVKERNVEAEVEYWMSEKRDKNRLEMGLSALRIVKGDQELGGRAILRIGPHAFHLSYSLHLPLSNKITNLQQNSLLLQSPNSAPIPIPSLIHLEQFLSEQVDTMVQELLSSKS